MNKSEIKNKIVELRDKLNKWNKEYYQDNNPSVSDLEYDKTLLELEELEKKYPQYIYAGSPSLILGSFADNKFKKVVHKKPMLSLSKAYEYAEIEKFVSNIEKIVPIENINFSVEPKIDGLSISLHYKNGFLSQALTRGDGQEGEDVSENIYQIKSIPKFINYDAELEVRGEIFLPKAQFNRLNSQLISAGEKPFANPRNAASGTLRQLDATIVKQRNLSAFLYELVDPHSHNIKTQEEAINFLISLGIPTNPLFKLVEVEELEEAISSFAEIKDKLDYDADGLVIKLNDLRYWDKMGRTAKFPKHSIAFKYEVETATSIIKDIKTTVGRTGKITYIANLEPVELNQTIVRAATLHNFNFIKDLNINIGDQVQIVKAGEIIPKVLSLVKKRSGDTFEKVQNCPCCNSKLIEIENNVDQFCINNQCAEMIINSIYHFASRKSLNIVGLGLSTVKDLYKNNLVKNIEDIFNLHLHKEELLKLERYADQKVNNLLNNIEKAKESTFSKILFALGIKHIGERAAKLISKQYSNFSQLIYEKDTLEKISTINNIGPKIIESLKEYLNKQENIDLLLKFDNLFKYQKNTQINSEKLTNLSFVITGKLNNARDYYIDLIETNGGKVSSSVSAKTSYLLAGDDAGSKLDKAKKLNIKIINEDEFNQLLK
ncbi:NAD-dependent DNA ligase LigA [Mycoplasmopsis caviae]|uniref:DNA ligase n=1 Tax=Mycoplasmopsis caviae TaxID=55603 RepID=A0A3P8MEE2_9BACT|nr:NAD-dependent DNA ligase LigA [Mycoplasmopsis caviae]UUD35678.1 NAD-dependent DNA ligase LigA [Mycoplasmopsis caviae]VDR41576.1 DNA ligase (NAD(+)) [Mycoplasmopsis caviae]